MNAVILCVGKLKEKWQAEGCAEYLKRLSRYGKYEVIAVDDVREPDKPSDALIRQAMDKEGAALMKHIRPTDRVVCLCIKAEAPDSVKLAEITGRWAEDGRRVVFVIGGIQLWIRVPPQLQSMMPTGMFSDWESRAAN